VPRLEHLEDRTVLSTLTVTNPADSGDGSLRAAIAVAQSGDQIVFDTSLKGQAITLTSGPLAITQSLDIEGPGADKLVLSANHASRIFALSGGVTVTIAGLTITEGMFTGNDGGGAIVNAGSSLTLTNDMLSNNAVLSDLSDNAQGGAIANVGGASLTVSNCLFSQNQALGNVGGSQANGGAIVNSASRLTVSHSTFSGNQAIGGDGGARCHCEYSVRYCYGQRQCLHRQPGQGGRWGRGRCQHLCRHGPGRRKGARGPGAVMRWAVVSRTSWGLPSACPPAYWPTTRPAAEPGEPAATARAEGSMRRVHLPIR
jgi:hypothetical protein